MDDYKTKFWVEELPIAVSYYVTLKTELDGKLKFIIVGRLDKNQNDKIYYIAVIKAEKENDCESIYVFPVESIMFRNYT